jgi:hypothetical protein
VREGIGDLQMLVDLLSEFVPSDPGDLLAVVELLYVHAPEQGMWLMPPGRPAEGAGNTERWAEQGPAPAARRMAGYLAASGLADAVALVVHPHADAALRCPAAGSLIRALRQAASESGVRLAAVAWASSVRAGAHWFSEDGSGVVPQLLVELEPGPARIVQTYDGVRVQRELDQPAPGSGSERAFKLAGRGPCEPGRALRTIVQAVEDVRAGAAPCLTEDALVESLHALAADAAAVRALLMTAETPAPLRALWVQLARAVLGRQRANAAALAAVAAFLSGDVAAAAEAARATLEADKQNVVGQLVVDAVKSRWPAAELAGVIRVAASLGGMERLACNSRRCESAGGARRGRSRRFTPASSIVTGRRPAMDGRIWIPGGPAPGWRENGSR